jgi:hypothetical protein
MFLRKALRRRDSRRFARSVRSTRSQVGDVAPSAAVAVDPVAPGNEQPLRLPDPRDRRHARRRRAEIDELGREEERAQRGPGRCRLGPETDPEVTEKHRRPFPRQIPRTGPYPDVAVIATTLCDLTAAALTRA